MARTVRREPLAEQAAGLLLERVRAGEWQVGARLPGETTLAPQLDVGRSTVREAIRLLAGQGVLEPRHGSGVFVVASEPQEGWGALVRRSDVVEVLEARLAIETEAASLAARRADADDLRALHDALALRTAPHGDVEAHVDADMTFHRALVAAAHNAVLAELFDAFVPRVRTAMVAMLRVRPVDELADDRRHAAIVAAVEDHDPTAAASASRTHLEQLKEHLA